MGSGFRRAFGILLLAALLLPVFSAASAYSFESSCPPSFRMEGVPEDMEITEAVSDTLTLDDSVPYREGGEFYLQLSGQLRAPVPVNSLGLFIWDERSLSLERTVSVQLDAPSDTVDADVLEPHLPMNRMRGGRKTLVIQGYADGQAFVLSRLFFIVRGETDELPHVTDLCEGLPPALTDTSVFSVWQPDEFVSSVEFSIPEGLNPAIMLLEWERPPDSFTVTQLDRGGNTLSAATYATGFFADSVELDAAAAAVRIVPQGDFISMCSLRVYTEPYAAYALQRWEPLPDKVDLMLFSAHEDDEFLFFGGMVPYYCAEGKTVAVTYLTDCGRHRYRESLEGLWTAGLKYHPIFLNWENGIDERIISLTSALGIWQNNVGDPLLVLVRLIRKYRPEVVVSHDFNGEYWHGQHELTARLVAEAVIQAADPAYDPDGGDPPWEVKKTYFHLYEENRIFMDWNQPLKGCPSLTSMMLACEGYDRHVSQQQLFSMEIDGVRYDNTCLGLYASTVGEDVAKNDLFEHIP